MKRLPLKIWPLVVISHLHYTNLMDRFARFSVFLFILILPFQLVTSTAASYTDPVTWVNAYSNGTGYTQDDQQIQPTPDGGYLIAGFDLGILKIDSHGSAQWHRAYYCCPGVDPLGVNGVVLLPDGYAALTGVSLDSGSAILLLRLDSFGQVIWSKYYRVRKYSSGAKIIRTRDGGFLIAGATQDSLVSRRTLLLKLGGGGSVQWQKTYNVSRVRSVAQLANGDFLLATEYFSVLRLQPNGNVRWQKKYSGNRCCTQGAMAVLPTGTFYLAGELGYQTSADQDSLLVLKADSSGKVLFSKKMTSNSRFDFQDITATVDGGVTINSRKAGGTNPSRTTLIRLNSDGSVLWRKEYFYRPLDGLGITYAFFQNPTDQGYVLSGPRNWLAKIDADGNLAHNCKNIVRSAPTREYDFPVTAKRHFPTVVAEQAVAVEQQVTSVLFIPTVQQICAP